MITLKKFNIDTFLLSNIQSRLKSIGTNIGLDSNFFVIWGKTLYLAVLPLQSLLIWNSSRHSTNTPQPVS